MFDFGIDLESQKGDKMVSKRRPKRFQIEHKTEYEKGTLLGPSWERLGPVLSHFGVHLGVKNNEKLYVLEGFVKNNVF